MSMKNPLEMEVVAPVAPDMSHPQYAFGHHAGQAYARQLAEFTGDIDFDDLFGKCRDVLRVKGADYTGGSGVPGSSRADRLNNFYIAAEAVGITPYQAWWVFFHKHLSAITTFLKKGKVESEPIEGRIVDAINYLALLDKMIKFEGEKKP